MVKITKFGNNKLLVRAFTIYVRPLLEYNSVLWSPYFKQDTERLENVQRRFTKRLVGLKHVEYSERLQRLNLYTALNCGHCALA